MKVTAADVRAVFVMVGLVVLALTTDLDASIVAGYLIGLTESNPFDR